MKLKVRVLSMLLAVIMTASLLPLTLFALDGTSAKSTDAMDSITAELGEYVKGESKSYDDGYIGIPVEITVLYDGEITVKDGYGIDATPVVIYVVNTAIERIGTESDVEIVRSMLERGFIVIVFDYLNSEKAVSPDLDWSVQKLRKGVTNGTYLSELSGLDTGNYCNNMVVPAGYNIEFNLVFFELDKHGSDGTFDKIVEIWNNDFRGVKGETLIKWTTEDGSRKATQSAFDGSTPVWYDENGNADADGEYIKVKHTRAERIEDCVKADGSPIDLSLYMHVVFPTSPENDVPVMVLSNSSEHLALGTQTADRPHFSGFLFNGYAAAVFDHGYTPMARNDHYGYFDGNHPEVGSVTGDNTTYSVHFYNESKINTAAMRYLRYLSASDHGTYAFKDTAIGVYGNSKGGWATGLGAEHPESFSERRIVPGYNGESRYEAGKTETVGFIDGGEPQPWTEYDGVTLDSGADFVYMGCGGGVEQITENHAPMFISCPTQDSSYYSTVNQFVNVCRNLDIPAIWFEINMGHTIASGPDLRYGVDTYDALFTFANYYLKDDAVKVIYSHRDDEYSGMPTNAPVTVKFSGPVSASEIEKITLKDALGTVVSGTWSSQYGGTEWTLTTPTLSGDTVYTLTVPEGIKGDNGKGMEGEHMLTFVTGYESASSVSSVKTENGTYFYFNVPADTKVFNKTLDVYKLRLNVTNDAVNKLEVFPLSGFNASSPDSATVGERITSVAVSGAGYYDIDVSKHVKSGAFAAFLVKQVSAAGSRVNNSSMLEDSLGTVKVYSGVSYTFAETPDGKNALRIDSVSPDTTSYVNDPFIKNPANLIYDTKIVKNGNLTTDDLGRTFKISFKVYDTVSRVITVKMNSLTNISLKFADYESYYFNCITKANEWTDVEFTYTVYEPKYEEERGKVSQAVYITAPMNGSDPDPIYISDLKSTEILTDVTFGGAELLLGTTEQREDPLITPYGTIPSIYEDADEYPVILFDKNGKVLNVGKSIVNGNGSEGVLSTIQNANATTTFPENDVIVYVRKSIIQEANYSNLSFQFGNILIDLAGNTLTCIGRLFQCQAKRGGVLDITVKNGTLLQKASSLIYYSSTSYSHETVGVREFNFNFENVTLGYTEGATAASFVQNAGSVTYPVKGDVTFTSCTLDLKTNAPSGTVFKISPGTNANILTNVYVKGGVIKANAITASSIVATGGQNEFKFIKDTSSGYTVLELPSTAAAPTGSYSTERESVCFTASGTESGITTYKLSVDPLWTPYGQIPSDYASETDYPFVLFKDNGDGTYTFQKADKDIFVNSSPLMVAARSIKAVIYLRRDFTTSSSFSNYAFCKDNTFDLGERTLTFETHNAPQGKKEYDAYITFKNGTIKGKSATLFRFNSTTGVNNSKFRFTFKDITFDLTSDTKYASPIFYFPGSSQAHGVEADFIGCTFNISGVIPSGGITLFAAGDSSGNCIANIRVSGGRIVTDTLSGVTLVSVKNTSTVTFNALNGVYTEIVSARDSALPSYKVKTDSGEKIFAVTSLSGGKEIYTLVSPTLAVTKYGNIPYKYASPEIYPFVSFEETGGAYIFAGTEENIFPDSSAVMFAARNKKTVILMRRDFVKSAAASHGNLCYVNKGLTLDLGGFTLTVSGGNAFTADAKKVSTVNDLVFKNGTVVLDSKTFIEFTSSLVPETDGVHTFNVTFSGVKLVLSGNAAILKYTDYNRSFKVNVIYDSCVIDMTDAGANATVYLAGSTGGRVVSSVTVIGGQVKGIQTTHTLVSEQNELSSVRFENGVNGYTELIGAPSEKIYFNTDGEPLKLTIKTRPNVYTLVSVYADGITALYGNSLNLKDDVQVQFYLDIKIESVDGAYAEIGRVSDYEGGTTVLIPISELKTKVIEGRTYYIVSYGIPAKDMGVTVIARLVKDGEVISTEYSYSAQTYIDTVLEKEIGGDITKELKDLVSALDVYGKNASAVLNGTAVEAVDEVDFSSVNAASGSKTGNAITLKKFSLELKSNIKLRVYFSTAADSFTVKVGDTETEAVCVVDNVWCIEYEVPATKLYDNLTFTVTAEDSSLTLTVSPLYYAKIINASATSTEAEKALMRAIKLYADAASDYMASVSR